MKKSNKKIIYLFIISQQILFANAMDKLSDNELEDNEFVIIPREENISKFMAIELARKSALVTSLQETQLEAAMENALLKKQLYETKALLERKSSTIEQLKEVLAETIQGIAQLQVEHTSHHLEKDAIRINS